jgi:DNA-directed RNA polymerase specialized sigma24 family protein
LEGFSVEEIAGSLRLGQSAVKMRLARARKMLEEKLTED